MTNVDYTNDEQRQEVDELSKQELNVHVGGRMRLRRSIVGMTQTSLAERLGLTFQQVQKYERGINRIAATRLYEIANILEVPLSFFFDDALPGIQKKDLLDTAKAAGVYWSDRAMETVIDASLFDRETSELLRAYYRITNVSVRRHVLALIKSMHGHEAESPSQES